MTNYDDAEGDEPMPSWPEGRFDDAGEATSRDDGVTADNTDLRNAERLVELFGEDLRYVHKWSKWLIWDGRRWTIDQTGTALRRASDSARLMFKDALEAYGECAKALALAPADEKAKDKEKRAKAALSWAQRSQFSPRLNATIDLARTFTSVAVRHDDLDADPWLFNVANGTLDLRTGTLRDPRREDLITKLANVVYDPRAMSPVWDRFLDGAMGGSAELVTFLQRMVGYSLTGVTREHVLAFHHGTGQNGKSTFLTTVAALLGDYGTAAPRGLLFRSGADRHPTELTCLFGVRLALCAEVEKGRAFDEALVKDLTGGDTISARRMGEDFWTWVPTHKFHMAGNHKPIVKGEDEGIWRRIRLVPWAVTVAKADRDTTLPERLRAELPGILVWAVRGCLDWLAHGLGEPREVLEATAAYRDESDALADFAIDRLVFEPDVKVARVALRGAYDAWCRENGVRSAVGPRAFADLLRKRGVVDGGTIRLVPHPNPVDAWAGVRLREPTEVRRTSAHVEPKQEVGTSIPLQEVDRQSEKRGLITGSDREVTTTSHYPPTDPSSQICLQVASRYDDRRVGTPWYEEDDYDPHYTGTAE